MALTLEQRIERQKGIGASDVGCILGYSPYANAADIYDDKVLPIVLEENTSDAARRGDLLEPIIVRRYQEKTGNEVKVKNPMKWHPEVPYAFANIDGYIPSLNAIFEAKSVHKYAKTAKEFGEELTDQMPTQYLLQNAWCHDVFKDRQSAYVHLDVAFVNDNSGTEASIERIQSYIYVPNERLIEGVIQKCGSFWNGNVIPRIRPAGESLRKANPFVEAKEADTETQEALVLLKSVNAQIKELTEYKGSLMKSIEDYIEEYEMLKDPKGKELASWKMQYSNRFDLKAFESDHPDLYKQYQKQITSRVFRLKD